MTRNSRLSGPVCLFASSILAIAGCGGGSVEMPASYETWNAKDGSFQLQYPANWEASGGGKQGIQWAKFISGGAEVRVDTEVSGGLVGDIVGVGQGDLANADPEVAEKLAPVVAVHEMKADALSAEINAYKEDAAVKFTSTLGEGRKSAFSGSQGLGTKIRGYRATVLGHDKAIRIVCRCPEKYWGELQSAFDKMLDSFGYGTPQQ